MLPCLNGQQRVILPTRAKSRRAGPSENRAGTAPRGGRRGNNSTAQLERFEKHVIEHAPRLLGTSSCCQLGCHDAREHSRWKRPAEKCFQPIQFEWLTEGIDKNIRVEGINQTARRIGSMVASPPTATS